MSLKIIDEDVKEVGKTIKSSKKLQYWKFELNGETTYNIELYTSKLTGKKKVTQNGQLLYENTNYSLVDKVLDFKFTIGPNHLQIFQIGERYELKINDQEFSKMAFISKLKPGTNHKVPLLKKQ